MKKIFKRKIAFWVSLIIIILNLSINFMYFAKYKNTWGSPTHGAERLYEIIIYDYLLGPGAFSSHAYPLRYIKLKIILGSIALLGVALYYIGKNLGRQILTICFSIYILFLIFLLLEIMPDVKEYYVSHFVLISFYNSILLAGSVYVVYVLNWAKGDKTITT